MLLLFVFCLLPRSVGVECHAGEPSVRRCAAALQHMTMQEGSIGTIFVADTLRCTGTRCGTCCPMPYLLPTASGLTSQRARRSPCTRRATCRCGASPGRATRTAASRWAPKRCRCAGHAAPAGHALPRCSRLCACRAALQHARCCPTCACFAALAPPCTCTAHPVHVPQVTSTRTSCLVMPRSRGEMTTPATRGTTAHQCGTR